MRTDLDSFTDVEAGCLQADGYQMSEPRLLKMEKFLSSERVSGEWQFDRFRTTLKSGDRLVLQHIQLGEHQFMKPFIYAVSGASSFVKTAGLLVVSLPLIASLIAIVTILNWVLKSYLGIDVIDILTSEESFVKALSDSASSKVADRLITGSGDLAIKIQKILKAPMAVISGLIMKIVLPAILAIPLVIYLYTIDRYFIRVMGKLV
jgi:NTE family protein